MSYAFGPLFVYSVLLFLAVEGLALAWLMRKVSRLEELEKRRERGMYGNHGESD